MRPDELTDDPEVDALLARLDHPVPEVSVEAVVGRARRRARAPWWRAAAIAAGLSLIAGGAWAAPGSPLPGWVAELRDRAWGARTPGPGNPPDAGAATDPRGIAVEARGGMVLRIVAGDADAWLRVSTWEGSFVEVRSPSASTAFTSDPDGLTVVHESADTLEIRIPLGVPGIRVLAGTREVFRTRADGVVTRARRSGEGWLVPLGPDVR